MNTASSGVKRPTDLTGAENGPPLKQNRLERDYLKKLYTKAQSNRDTCINERIAASKYLSYFFQPENIHVPPKKVAKLVLLQNLQYDSEILQQNSLVVIRDIISKDANMAQYLVAQDLFKNLLKPLLSDNHEICEHVLTIIEEILDQNDNKKRFLKINGHTALLEILSSEYSTIRFKAATILNIVVPNIKIDDIYKNEKPVFKVNKIFDFKESHKLSVFFQYMKHPNHILQYCSCCCFYAYLEENENELKEIFIELNTQINVSPLVALLSSPKAKVRTQATLLVNVLVSASSGNKKQFLQAGALRILPYQLPFLNRRELAVLAIKIFSNISRNQLERTVSTHLTESIELVIQYLISLLQIKNPELFKYVLIALENFIVHPDYRDFCIKAGILLPLFKAVQSESPSAFHIPQMPLFFSTLYESSNLSIEKIRSTIPALQTLLHIKERDIISASTTAIWKLGNKFENRFRDCFGNYLTSIMISLIYINPNENNDEKIDTFTKPLDQNIAIMLLTENTLYPQLHEWKYLPNNGQTLLDQFSIFLTDDFFEITQECNTREIIKDEKTLLEEINEFSLPFPGIEKPVKSLKHISHESLFIVLFIVIVQLHTHPEAIEFAQIFMERNGILIFDPVALRNDILNEFSHLSLGD